jgi:DNA-binding winged helix-turn-helix (wHTH) protein
MVKHNAPSRRVLVVDVNPDALDSLVGGITTLLADAGCAVRHVMSEDPAISAVPPLDNEAAPVTGGVVTVGDLVVCADARRARRAGVDLDLTRVEFDLLVEFLRHRNRVLTKDALMASVWHHEPVTCNAIEARISRLRAKLERRGSRLIHTVRGVGYVLHALPDPATGPQRTVLELVADDLVLDLAPHGMAWPPGGRQ